MHLNDYQEATEETAVYPGCGDQNIDAVIYTVLGLNGEAGEVAEKLKKCLRDNEGELTDEIVEKLVEELGDTLWYVARTALELGYDLEQIAVSNLDKLERRKKSGTLSGSGDSR